MADDMTTAAMPPEVIDTHHHFWRHGDAHQDWRGPEHGALERDFQPDDLRPALEQAGVHRTVLVQSVNTTEENARLLDYAAACPFIAGIIAWCPLDDPGAARDLLPALLGNPLVRGVRCLIGRGEIDWLLDPDVVAVLRELAAAGLCWDVVPVTAAQVDAVLAVAERVPDLRLVIDHLGRPPLDHPAGWEPWADRLARLAAAPNVALKVSVGIDVLTGWEWDAAALPRYVAPAVSCFGADRLMLASNWPVLTLRQEYAPAWRDLELALRSAGLADLAGVRGGNAVRWYRLPAGAVRRPKI